jgi:outer membrane protein
MHIEKHNRRQRLSRLLIGSLAIGIAIPLSIELGRVSAQPPAADNHQPVPEADTNFVLIGSKASSSATFASMANSVPAQLVSRSANLSPSTVSNSAQTTNLSFGPLPSECTLIDLSKPIDLSEDFVSLPESIVRSETSVLPMSPFERGSEANSEELVDLIRHYANLAEAPSSATTGLELSHPQLHTVEDNPNPFYLVSLGMPEVPDTDQVASPVRQSGVDRELSQLKMILDNEQQSVDYAMQSMVSKSASSSMKPLPAPPWMGQIHFAMLRYSKHRDLSLQDAVHTAIQFSPEIEILRADVGISEAEITKQNSAFDWATFLQSNWDERNVPISSSLDGAFNRLENHTLANSGGLKKQNQLGGAMRLAQDLGFADSNSQFFTPANQANSRIALEYQQPLLQGAGLLVNRSRINIAIANAGITQEQFIGGLQIHLLSVINAYWDLVARRGEYVIQKRSYDRAMETATVVSNRVHLDVGPVQSARSEATLSSRRATLLATEYAIVLAQEKLLRLMFGACFRDSVETEIIPTSSMLGPSRSVDMEMELQLGLQCRPEVRQSLQAIKRTAIEQGVARNQLLPLLGMTMSLSNKGLQGNNGLASAYNDQFSFGDPTYGVGLSYALPVGNRAAKANLRQAEIRLSRFQKEFETVISDVALEIRNACHNVAWAGQQREATKQALNLAERELAVLKTRAELLLDGDNVGPLYLDDLLTTQQRVASAELAFLNASAQHALSYFELQRATGSLLRSGDMQVDQIASR